MMDVVMKDKKCNNISDLNYTIVELFHAAIDIVFITYYYILFFNTFPKREQLVDYPGVLGS